MIFQQFLVKPIDNFPAIAGAVLVNNFSAIAEGCGQ
jgi:hypothetical protein